MKVVGVKQLKARLSEYVRLVKAGETILVTDRDEVVAELRPARRQRRVEEDWEDLLESLADARELTRASVPKVDWTWRVKGLGLSAGTAERTLGGIRADATCRMPEALYLDASAVLRAALETGSTRWRNI
jgi:antitoxin (DNA-binding transcriptional repressor) of toxin-antitoxin stability system